ncbi:MAG: LuxR C-terminal-related transcriptional regulator [Nocardioidaceae bacterium]
MRPLDSPIPATAPAVAPDVAEPASLLVGRDQELARMLQDVRHGLGVVVRGPAGIGKTHLLNEVRHVLAAEGVRTLALRPADADPSRPLGVFRTAAGSSATAGAIHADLLAAGTAAVFVDEAQLIDAQSAGLLHQLATSGVAAVVALRASSGLPEGVLDLVRIGRARELELRPLDEAASYQLLAREVGDHIDDRAAATIVGRSGGNPLFLTELAREARRVGALVLTPGGWQLLGPLPPAPSATGLVAGLLDGLAPEVLDAARTVALGEPLPLEIALAAAGEHPLEAAEAHGVLVVDTESGELRLPHPLYRDAVLATTPPKRAHQLRKRLLSHWRAAVGDGAPTLDERLRFAALGLDLGEPPEVAELLSLAEVVQSTDSALFARLVDAASRRAATTTEKLRLANLLTHCHATAEASAVLDSLDLSNLDDASRIGVRVTRAFLNAMPEHRPTEALAELDDVLAEHGPLPDVLAVRSTALWRLGRFSDAHAQAAAVYDDPRATVAARVHAGLTLASVATHAGNAAARTLLDDLAVLAEAAISELPEGPASVRLVLRYAALFRGDALPDVLAGLAEDYERALVAGDDGVRAQHGNGIAWAEMLAGDAAAAADRFVALAAVSGMWVQTTRHWFAALRMQALAAAGRITEAKAHLAATEQVPHAPVYDVDLAMARATVLAHTGDLAAAERLLLNAADAVARTGGRALASWARYLAVTHGSVAAAALLGGRHTPGLNDGQRAHAAALSAQDPDLLLRAAGKLAATGHRWYAATAAAQAALLGADRSDRATSAAAWSNLAGLLPDGARLVVPALQRLSTDLLTAREREVADLAADGATDAAIAEALGISLRTVQTHLGRVFAGLGLATRRDLPQRLALLDAVSATADA